MKIKNFCFSFLIHLFISEISLAQITFQKTYGGGLNHDWGASVQQTTDGGYVIVGLTLSLGAGNTDIFLIKTDTYGDLLWTKTFGGTGIDEGKSVQQTTDRGYIITGITNSFSAAYYDVYLIKTDANGDILWTRTFGGIGDDYGYSVQQTTDGGYIIAGYTRSFGSGYLDVYLIKTDINGDSLWTKTFGGAGDDLGLCVQQTSDGGYIITGNTFGSFGAGLNDFYLVKADSIGNLLWTKTYGGTNHDYSFSIRQTANGEYIIVGYTSSFGAGSDDVYLIKVDANGNSLWTKTYGGANYDGGGSVQQTADAGFIIVGFTSNFGAGQNDVYLIKTDLNGDTLWTKTFGGTHYDNGFSIQRTSDGGYIITGENDDGDSVYLIKTDSLGNSGCNQSGTTTIVTNPVTQETTPATNVTSPPTIVTTPATITSSGGTVTTLCTTVGIQSEIQNPQSAISISPNPFHSITTLTVNNNLFNDNLTLSIFNVEGKILRQQNLTSHQTIIERNGMANGLYFYKLAENGIVKSVGKLLVE